jgi:hypothetical protein
MLPGSAPAASKPVALLSQYIAQKKEEPEALQKAPVPVISPSFQELYEDDWCCTKNGPAC